MRGLRKVSLCALLLAIASCSWAQSADRGIEGIVGGSTALTILDSGCAETGGSLVALLADDSKGHGFDLANLDRSISPCADFYQFAAGGWMKNNPIPAAYPRWGSFTILQEHNQDVLRSILEEAAKETAATPGSNRQKIGDFYSSCMDESQIEAAGLKPLQSEFERIAQIKSAARIPLTLHGGSGTDDEDFRKAIAAGISLVHINTELRVAWRRGLDDALTQHPHEVVPYKILPTVVKAVEQVVQSRLSLFSRR